MIEEVRDNPDHISSGDEDLMDYVETCCICGKNLYEGDFVFEFTSLPFGISDVYCEECARSEFGRIL